MMGRPKKRKKVLLIEPNYANKFPPIGLMKLSTYYKNLGNWDVVFFKGDLKDFVIERITERCVDMFCTIDKSIDWSLKKDIVFDYIKTRKRELITDIGISNSNFSSLLLEQLKDFKDYYWKGVWKDEPEWDRVGVTTLFTFYWDITIETINFAKLLVKKRKDLMIGGVLASIQPLEIEKATGIKPHVGILNIPGQLDKGDTQIIDELPLDYSILDEIDYKYPMANAFYSYMSRGCIRHCPFCAVPTLEPVYNPYIKLSDRITKTRETYGDQKDLLLMDNNVLASDSFAQIIDEIKKCGFERGATFIQPNLLDLSVNNLRLGINDRAYIRKTQSIIIDFYEKIKDPQESLEVYKILEKYHIKKLLTTKKQNLLDAYNEVKPYYDKHFKPSSKQRYVDFNQGVDARLFTEEKAQLLSTIAIRPLRVAFDDIKTLPSYEKAIRWSAQYGIKNFSNYLLYNFKDIPCDLYKRLEINVKLCEELNINIYSFPMKYHPLRMEPGNAIDYSHNRDYIGKYWNRKYIRAVQTILNSTKGQIGRGQSFFYEAFGKNESNYLELLEMPDSFLLYRFFFKWLDDINGIGPNHWRNTWNKCKNKLSDEEWQSVLRLIHGNEYNLDNTEFMGDDDVKTLFGYYKNYRNDIVDPNSEFYKLKKEYDSHPIIKTRRNNYDN